MDQFGLLGCPGRTSGFAPGQTASWGSGAGTVERYGDTALSGGTGEREAPRGRAVLEGGTGSSPAGDTVPGLQRGPADRRPSTPARRSTTRTRCCRCQHWLHLPERGSRSSTGPAVPARWSRARTCTTPSVHAPLTAAVLLWLSIWRPKAYSHVRWTMVSRHRAGADRPHPVPAGAAADDAGLRRHRPAVRPVGLRPGPLRRRGEPVRRDAEPARRLGRPDRAVDDPDHPVASGAGCGCCTRSSRSAWWW